MNIYRSILRPLLFSLDAEAVHHLALRTLRVATPVLQALQRPGDPRLARTVFGVKFPNPVGLAAGFDKNAVALPAWAALGLGFAEVGTITARAQEGNEQPRIFRLPADRALINRLGFNNEGADVVAERLRRLRASGRWPAMPVGINLGKSKVTPLEEATADYLLSFERLQHYGDYFVLNISSPNTPGLRSLQDRAALDELLSHIQRRNGTGRPILVKIAPDLNWEDIEAIIALVDEHKLAGIVATNTTINHDSVPISQRTMGGLSGAPLRERSTAIVRFIAQRTSAAVIAVGGIFSEDDALEKLDAGAALIQLYTGYVYEGPSLPKRICAAFLRRVK